MTILFYILVSLVTVGNLPVDKIVVAKDYALAESARPFFGRDDGEILQVIGARIAIE